MHTRTRGQAALLNVRTSGLCSSLMEPTVAPTEELIGGERVQLRQSAVRAIKAPVILEAKLFVGTEKSFLISLTKEVSIEKSTLLFLTNAQTLYFSRPDDKAVHQGAATISPLSLMAAVTSSIDLYDILAVEGVNEAAVKTDNAVRYPISSKHRCARLIEYSSLRSPGDQLISFCIHSAGRIHKSARNGSMQSWWSFARILPRKIAGCRVSISCFALTQTLCTTSASRCW